MANLTPEEIADLREQRKRLVKAMRSGARDVQHEGKRVSYRSIDEMQDVIDDIDEELAAAEGAKPARRVIYLSGDRGYR